METTSTQIYEETPGWEERVYAAFSAIAENNDTLIADMGERASAAAVAEAMLHDADQALPAPDLGCGQPPG